MSTTAKPRTRPTIEAVRKRLGEIESTAWILRLLLDGAELPTLDHGQLLADVDDIHGLLEQLARRIAAAKNVQTVGSIKCKCRTTPFSNKAQ